MSLNTCSKSVSMLGHIHKCRNLISRINDYATRAMAYKTKQASLAATAGRSRSRDSSDAILQTHRDELDKEGVLLWNRSTVVKQAQILKSCNSMDTCDTDSSTDNFAFIGLGMLQAINTYLQKERRLTRYVPKTSPLRRSLSRRSWYYQALRSNRCVILP